MFKKISDCFAGGKMTAISGLSLAISLVCMLFSIDCPFDFAWISVILSGYPLLYLAITRLYYDHWISSCLLISIAMVASLAIGEIFAAGEVAFIMAIGANLEDLTVNRAKKGLSALMNLAPKQARRIVDDKEEMIDVALIQIEDHIRIQPGEVIPCDGKILTGETSVDQSVLTGESLPVDKLEGDFVYCGTMNCFGSIDIAVTTTYEDTSLQHLIDMVEKAEEKKAPMQRIADQWSVWLVPIALTIAIAATFINAWMGTPWMASLNRGVTVLVVFCPCALALATPTSIMAAIAQATKHGVIIKSGEALEAMGKVDVIALDKTGTITYGNLVVSDILSFSDESILSLVASIEKKSEHPLAKAIYAYALENNVEIVESSHFKMQAGRGVQAVVDDQVYYCGSASYLQEHGVLIDEDIQNQMSELQNEGKALVLAANSQKVIGIISLCDELRPDIKNVLSNLDVKTVLLTGDSNKAANYFAKEAGIDTVRSQLLPEEKVACIEEFQKEDHVVCMIGDGINDAPALKTSDVGVAMGGIGSDITIEASDIVFMQDHIGKIGYLNHLAKSCIKTIKFNITVSMCINAVAVTLSVLGVLNPVTGAIVHNAGSCLVVLNAALLYDRKFE